MILNHEILVVIHYLELNNEYYLRNNEIFYLVFSFHMLKMHLNYQNLILTLDIFFGENIKHKLYLIIR